MNSLLKSELLPNSIDVSKNDLYRETTTFLNLVYKTGTSRLIQCINMMQEISQFCKLWL